MLVVGGGINGVGVARDAAGRGLSVLLCEQADLGGATSSASTKLLHGGLRYLEHYRFRMVRESLAERETLLAAAPYLARPLRFVLPHGRGSRPFWLLRFGLWVYDHLARRNTLPASRTINLLDSLPGEPLRDEYRRGFVYSDCWVDDARLVIANALDAQARGATILTRHRLESASRNRNLWYARLVDARTGEEREVRTRCIVNAAGPWAESVARERLGLETRYAARLVRGSHIVVPRLYSGDWAYTFQVSDRRILFALPFEDDYTLIGTTDVPVTHPEDTEASDAEIDYLCSETSAYLNQPVTPGDVVWAFAGVRPLFDDGSESASDVSRDYQIEIHNVGGPPALTIWGGKLTGYRVIAEAVMRALEPVFPGMGPAWTAGATLPGGDLHPPGIQRFTTMVTQVWPWLPLDLARAYARRYGSRIHTMLGNCSEMADLGEELAPGLYEREARYLTRHEWAETAEDILWRRTKVGLQASPDDQARVETWLQENGVGREPSAHRQSR